MLNEKYDPFKQSIDDNGEICYPRYEKDTAKYRKNLSKQAEHLLKQLYFFNETLVHAFPSREKKGLSNYHEELQSVLVSLIYKLESFCEDRSQDYDYYYTNY